MMNFGNMPIPPLNNTMGWEKVNIHENREKLIRLSKLSPNRITLDSQYFKRGLTNAIDECYVREKVSHLLLKASKLLPTGWKFVVFDAWRSLLVQEELFRIYKRQLQSNYTEVDEKKLNEETKKFVSYPSSDLTKPSPHVTGGAIDLTMMDETGANLGMGTEFDSFTEKAHTRFYELKLEKGDKFSAQELIYLKNRRRLFHTLISVGFTNYPEEWWHFDYGNQFWGRIKEENAVYGIISPTT